MYYSQIQPLLVEQRITELRDQAARRAEAHGPGARRAHRVSALLGPNARKSR